MMKTSTNSDAEWSEEAHPRDKDGEFANGGGQAASTTQSIEPKASGPHTVASYGGDEKQAHKMLIGFRANVFDERAITFKGAVGKVFGVDASQDADRIARLMQAREKVKAFRDPRKKSLEGARAIVARNLEKGAAQASTVAAMAKVSQEAYAEPMVRLYRGITGKQAAEIIAAHASGKLINVRMDTTTSFTDSKGMAKQFARRGSTRRNASPTAVVIKMDVPRESIVASHRAFKELSKESEVVVATHGGYAVPAENIEIITNHTHDAVDVPAVAQTNNYNCGAAALLSVLKSFGQVPPNLSDGSAVDKLSESLGTTPEDGTAPEDIVRVAELFDIPARWQIGVSVDQLRAALAADQPVILDLQEPDEDVLPSSPDGHYVVLTELSADTATVMNPSGGTLDRIPLETLLDRWIDEEGRYGAIFFGGAKADAGDWDESKHPRAKDGKFGEGGGSSSASSENPENPVSTSMSGKALIEHAVKQGGFTLDVANRAFATHGYAVSIYQQHEQVITRKLTGADIKNYIKEKSSFIKSNPTRRMGIWFDAEKGKWYLDVSHVTQDRKEAVGLSKKYNQEGIFSLHEGKTIITKKKNLRR